MCLSSEVRFSGTWQTFQRLQLIETEDLGCSELLNRKFCWFFIVIIIYPLTARVVGAPHMISQPVSSIFSPVLHCPPGLGELQACPFPDIVFPPLPLSAFVYFPPFTTPRKMVLAGPNERGDMSVSLQYASLFGCSGTAKDPSLKSMPTIGVWPGARLVYSQLMAATPGRYVALENSVQNGMFGTTDKIMRICSSFTD